MLADTKILIFFFASVFFIYDENGCEKRYKHLHIQIWIIIFILTKYRIIFILIKYKYQFLNGYRICCQTPFNLGNGRYIMHEIFYIISIYINLRKPCSSRYPYPFIFLYYAQKSTVVIKLTILLENMDKLMITCHLLYGLFLFFPN